VRHRAVVLALVLLLATWVLPGCGTDVFDSEPRQAAPAELPTSDVDPVSGLPWVLEVELPPSAQETLMLVDAGGPFPYDKDGSTFGNREGLLPDEASGYYAEYTVPKPGEDDRGPWRLVAGDGGEVYWTEDHYSSFERVWR
jgi:ribonuclease T1